MSEDWKPSAAAPTKLRPTEEQIERIKAHLWSVGITQDPFSMDPVKRLAWLSSDKYLAQVVYAAIKHEFPTTTISSFKTWCQEIGLPW